MPSSSRRRSSSFRIWSWIVTSSAVVGSSASSSVGCAGERDGDHRPLAHAAGELVRIVVEALARGRDADDGRAARRRARAGARRSRPVCACRFSSICRPIGQHGIERASSAPGRSSRSRAPRTRAQLALGHADEVAPAPARRCPSTRPGARTQAAGCARSVTLLPEPDSPTRPSTSPWRSVEVDAVDGGAACRAAVAKRDAQAADARAAVAAARHRRVRQQVGEAVAEQAEAEARQHDRDAGEDRDPPGGAS